MSTYRENGAESDVVSAAYRELAVETTPPGLDEAILAMAKTGNAALRQTDNRMFRWTRPLAWAATVGLCLAIVLEVSRQQPTVGYDHAAKPETAALEGELPDQSGHEERQSLPEAELDRSTLADRNREALQQLSPVSIEPKAGNDASAAPGAPVLPAAESEAAIDETSAVATEATALKRSFDEVAGCHRDTRASAELWLECIRTLRRDGKTDLATSEYTEYLKRFPDAVEKPATE